MKSNRRFLINIMADGLLVLGVSLVPPIVMSLICGEYMVTRSMSLTALVCLAAGAGAKWKVGLIKAKVMPRMWYMTAFFTWILVIFATVPIYLFSIPGCTFIDAVLESSAGWTTTGTGVYDMSTMPLSLQLCRAICNWLGGVGIIMTIMTFIPPGLYIGWGLVSTEFPGPSFLKGNMPFRKGYRTVVAIYMAFTAIQFILLAAADMPVFTSVLTALSNTSTSGLRHINNGIVGGLPGSQKVIITLFAFLGSVNSTVFLLVLGKKWNDLKKSSEHRFYACRIIVTALLISGFVIVKYPEHGFFKVFTDALMQVIAFVSTSGYIIADCHLWPQACMLFIMLQMFIGSCALSTGGGIKEARVIIALKTAAGSIYGYIHPSSVRATIYDEKPMTGDQIIRANLFIALFMITYLSGALVLSLDNIGVYEALGYSQAMLTNTGSFAGDVLATVSPADFSALSKAAMCLLMVAGRLEIYPFIMIFMRSFWRPDKLY